MPLHCSYCHKPNHSRLDCSVRSAIRCWSCLTTEHIAKRCPQRSTSTNQPSPPVKPNPKSKKPVKNQSPSVPEPQSSKRSLSHSDSEPEPEQPRMCRPPLSYQPNRGIL
ncbi:hypothetical protein [Absidia glauca]|uniref:CCHC-type domain-containing protein n=1 Tax=Absidia glauca TaxID=4829 RepID=A0A168LJE6_ABSGL|nr:hypothetical protein [Absidia glauca]